MKSNAWLWIIVFIFRWLLFDMLSSVGSTKKPEDMYRIIEHFALGRRRLELFGEDHNIRPGWLTLGKNLSYSNFNKEVDWWTYNACAHPMSSTYLFTSSLLLFLPCRRILEILLTRMGKYGKEAVVGTLPQRLLTSLWPLRISKASGPSHPRRKTKISGQFLQCWGFIFRQP